MPESLMSLQLENSDPLSLYSYDFETYMSVDQTGLPNTSPKAGIINVVLLFTAPTSNIAMLEEWITSQGMKKGTIVPQQGNFVELDFGLAFYNAFCVRYKQTYLSEDKLSETSSPFKIHLTISAQTIELIAGNVKIENAWTGITPSANSGNSNSNGQDRSYGFDE